MIKKTNLDGVKEVTKMFVDLDIQETRFGSLVIKHPFIESAVTVTQGKDGRPQMVDLINDPAAFENWKQNIKSMIDSKDNAASIFWLVVKAYRLAFLKYTSVYLDRRDLSVILSDCWVTVEYPSRDPNLSKRELIALFKKCDPDVIMAKDELEAYAALPETVTIYRGVTKRKKADIKGLSWSTSSKTAEWFAKRFGNRGIVYRAVIEKRYICAYFLGRNEFETVVDPSKIQKVEVYKDFGE